MALTRSSRPYRVAVDIDTATTTALVAAVANKQIVVVNIALTVASGQTIQWQSGSTAISGPMGAGYTAGDAWSGLMETVAGEALNLVTTSTGQVAGHITYVLL